MNKERIKQIDLFAYRIMIGGGGTKGLGLNMLKK
jgi:hypothetical protein